MMALVFGDLFMNVVYRTRPYEAEKGSANELHRQWNEKCVKVVNNGNLNTFKKYIYAIVKDFDNLPLINDLQKPRVGVVGEILVKFHPTANNDVVSLLEDEGAEAVVPDIIGFLLYCAHNAVYNQEFLGWSWLARKKAEGLILSMEFFRKHLKKALHESNRFHPPLAIDNLGELAKPIVSLGNQMGEGWFLTAEMVELIRSDVPNIICMQPFACLPNHVTGKGVIKALRHYFPLSNIVAVDYDAGASEVNQLNRIKLMLSTARRNMREQKR
jgi:predicted nucleotide-binding protein (sugar kinase/HSP70/actin superfamily)